MGHLQDRARQEVGARQEALLGARLDVPGEQEAEAPRGDPQGERRVVDRRRPELRRGVEHRDVGERRRAVEFPDKSAARPHGGREPLPFYAVSGHAAPPELRGVKVREQVGDAAEVVGMRVRHGHRIEPEDLPRQQEGRDDGPSRVEFAAREAAGVDHHHAPAG